MEEKEGLGKHFKQRKQPRCAFQKPKAGAEARHAGSSKSPRQPRGWARWEGDESLAQWSHEKQRGRGRPWSPVAKTPCSQCRGPGFDPWSGNQILQAPTKESACCNREQRSRALQRRAASEQTGASRAVRAGEGEQGGGDTRASLREHALPCDPQGDLARAALTWLGDGRRQDDTVEPLHFLQVLGDLVNVDARLLDL